MDKTKIIAISVFLFITSLFLTPFVISVLDSQSDNIERSQKASSEQTPPIMCDLVEQGKELTDDTVFSPNPEKDLLILKNMIERSGAK